MAARNKPFEQFGPYILFRKLESDSLGELWRAGLIENAKVGKVVALRRISGGNRQALAASAVRAGGIVPQLTGTSFAREQIAGTVDGVPFIAWQYGGGRSLRYIMNRARGGADAPPSPLPLDQAIVIAEKVALSLGTMFELRESSGERLSHGAPLPQFVWITDDGEIRVAGQQFGAGMTASLADPKVAAEFAGYFPPEARGAAQPPKNGDVYSMGALLYLLVTGNEPPDAVNASAFGAAVRGAKTMTGEPLPDDIRTVLDHTLNIDPSRRYPSMAEAKQAIAGLAHGGRYSASTFNLAFYLSNLLKKEIETEPAELEKETKLNLAPYLETPRAAPPQKPVEPPPAMFSTSIEQPSKKSRGPLLAAAAVLVVAAGIGAYLFYPKGSSAPQAAAKPAAAQAARPAAPKQQPVIEPIVASATPQTAATGTAAEAPDAATQKKAFEDAVRQKLQAEMMKLQNQYMAELKQSQSKNAPVASAPVTPAAPVEDDRAAVSAAQLDQQRREAAPRTEPQAETPQPAVSAPATTAPAVSQAAAPAPARQQPAVREGDVIDFADLDSIPRPVRPISPVYPSLARQQKISATVFMTVLVSESGDVGEVKVLRGENRFGINDAAVRALKATRFTPPMKDGKRVKTWFPQTIHFRP